MRKFISRRKQEQEAYLSRRTKSANKKGEKDAAECIAEESTEAPSDAPADEEKHNGECQVPCETVQEESCSTHEENSSKGVERNALPELKSPRVLEVLILHL